MTITDALTWKLCAVVGGDKVFPDAVPIPDDPDEAALPAVTYRQTGGYAEKYLDAPRSPLRTDTFMVEAFAFTRAAAEAVKNQLLAAFRGPVDADPAKWAAWPTAGGLAVGWAEADDPAADADFPTTDAHRLFRYAQVHLTVTYLEAE